MYENFSALNKESLDSIFNRLQKIVSELAILGENISQEDINLKFLRSLPSEWNTHVVVWRNNHNLDTISFVNLYNNFKIVEQEVKGTTSSSSSSQNMAFVSSPTTVSSGSGWQWHVVVAGDGGSGVMAVVVIMAGGGNEWWRVVAMACGGGWR
nr:hypothetical protein [Tanacetum cinerariifolium]